MAGYGSDEAFEAWLAANGYTLPVSAPTPAILRERGSNYVDAVYGARFTGEPTGGMDQPRQWPRTNATYYGNPITDTAAIPLPVETASYFAAWAEASTPGSLNVTVVAGRLVKRQRVEGAVEREFFAPGAMTALEAMTPVLLMVDGLLAPFLIEAIESPLLLVV